MYKIFVNICFWKSCSFRFSCTITGTISWNNILTYHQIILLYYLHQKILKEKSIFKKCGFFGQACFLHLGNWVFAYHTYIFPLCDINYLYINEVWLHNLWMNCASLDHVLWTSTTCLVSIKPIFTYWGLDVSYAFGCS